MTRELPENDPRNNFMEDGTQPSLPPADDETLELESAGDPGSDDSALPLEVPTTSHEAEGIAEAGSELSSLETTPAESIAEATPPADAATSTEPTTAPPKPTTETDWSNFVPAPGYADPETGRPVFRYGNIDEAGCELMKLVEGLRPIYEPDTSDSGIDQLAPPSFLPVPPHGDAAPPFVPPNQSDSGPSPSISIDVRVSFTNEALEQISNKSTRKAAEYSRTELLIVARKLYELDGQIRDRELQRRILARQY